MKVWKSRSMSTRNTVTSRMASREEPASSRIVPMFPIVARVWDSYRTFLEESEPYQRISEQAYLATRI